MLAYAVRLRGQEIGIRMALGAQRGAVLRMVLQRGIVLMTIGIVGVAPARRGGRAICPGCWLPARRAGRLDPVAGLGMQ